MSEKNKIKIKLLKSYVENADKILELAKYIIVGLLVTVIDWTVFFTFNEVLKLFGYMETDAAMTAQITSWIAAVTAAYILNKELVFENHNHEKKHMAKEVIKFFIARLISGIISLFIFWVMVDKIVLNEYVGKVIITVFNLVFNYIASKFFVFKSVATE